MNEFDFLKHFIANSNQFMWFLGAGTSRTAGMPTATDIVWDLKLKYYCQAENQDIQKHDINNETVRKRIQSYMDSQGFPQQWSAEEYSFYFELTFGTDYSAQQKYLIDTLSTKKISLNVGHRALAGLMAQEKTKIVFTTNFDEVIETAYSRVSSNVLTPYHLEGSYAALDAYNNDRFPLYAKIHGDFRYKSVKNLSQDLLSNDLEIQKCFLAAASRYGMIISGYSGRDNNVMSMFESAIDQNNAFSAGLFWTVPSIRNIDPIVQKFIKNAVDKGINAHIVETGTFDSMLSKIWKQIPDRNIDLDKKVRTAMTKSVNIPMGSLGNSFPVLRLNALPITSVPENCALVKTHTPLSMVEVKERVTKNQANAQVSKTDRVLAFGSTDEIKKALGEDIIQAIEPYKIEEVVDLIVHSTGHHSFFERALVKALAHDKPLKVVHDFGWVIRVDHLKLNDPKLDVLKTALEDKYGNKGQLSGSVPRSQNTFWSEAVAIKLEKQNGQLLVTLTPMIWIDPRNERGNHKEFTKGKTGGRYNPKTSKLLDAWITVLLGDAKNSDVEITCNPNTDYPATFKINTRTIYSRR